MSHAIIGRLFFKLAVCVFAAFVVQASAALLHAQAPAGGEADNLFRNLDADGNGMLTMNEGRPDQRGMRQQIFTMAGKPATGSVSRQEFQVVFDQVRGGQGGPRPNPAAPRPMPNTPTPPTPVPAASPSSTLPRSTTRPINGAAVAADTGPQVWRGWIVMGRGENPNAGQMQIELTITGNRITGREVGTNRAPPGGLGAGTFVMTTTDGRTGTLDAVATEGPNAGKNYPGIFQMEGDTLRWCVSNTERRRPTELASMGASAYLMVLQRQRAQ